MSTVVALLYPFEWQHTCITVLPSKLIDIVDAPTPYLVGILASTKELLGDHYLAEVLECCRFYIAVRMTATEYLQYQQKCIIVCQLFRHQCLEFTSCIVMILIFLVVI